MYLAPLLLIAAAFWGQTPACGTPEVSAGALAPVGGLSTVGLADYDRCRITVDLSRATPRAGIACMVVVHEYGHLLGFGHSDDRQSVMYPITPDPFWPCRW